MAESSGQERSEKPTHRRIQKAHDRGEIAQSREWPATLVLFGGLFLILSFKFKFMSSWQELFQHIIRDIPSVLWREEKISLSIGEAGQHMAGILLPIFSIVVIAAVVGGLSQSGFVFTFSSLRPQFSRLNPFAGIKNLVSEKIASESLKNIFKLSVVSWIAYFHVRRVVDQSFLYSGMASGPLLLSTSSLVFKFCVHAAIFMVAYSALDYALQRRKWMQQMMMTRQEIKEEMRESEGNPQIKSKIKSLMKKLMGKRMMSQVKDAQVVVTNPTHLAIALQYKKNMKAPIVLAKGADLMAKKIIATARQHNVPVVENKPLARLLYRWVEIGDDVPANLYQAVAELLAYVYRLRQKVWNYGSSH